MKLCICGKQVSSTQVYCNSCAVNNRRFKLKDKCIEYLGSKCIVCGYFKCKQALEFHHKDPSKKDFSISGNHTRSWDSIKNELDKCDLLCSNCHQEMHYILNKQLQLAKQLSTINYQLTKNERRCLCGRIFVVNKLKGNAGTLCNTCRVNKRRKQFKQNCIDLKGGCCSNCQYSKLSNCLVFHHVDPSTKKFSLNQLRNNSFNSLVKAELDKCILLCHNCHREKHSSTL